MKNNVIGTHTVAALAAEYSSESFVLISTDKAVNPSSMMGASKRAAEAVCVAFDSLTETRFTIVRFGNVLGSAGSVVPLFARQIAEGGPVTVTHPEMTRYFMTLAEASQLILQASLIGEGSEIYVLNMGEPVNIAYLARQMILLSGRLPEKEVDIVFTGLRSGEKLKEELFHPEEVLSDTGYDKILLAATRSVDAPVVLQDCLALEQACSDYNELHIEAIINRLVPEYQWGEWNHRDGSEEPA
jgi:FlaA1/EpsC-like NDP-sugar epimerase